MSEKVERVERRDQTRIGRYMQVQFLLRVPEGNYCSGGLCEKGWEGQRATCEFFDNYKNIAECKMDFGEPKRDEFGYLKANTCLELMEVKNVTEKRNTK